MRLFALNAFIYISSIVIGGGLAYGAIDLFFIAPRDSSASEKSFVIYPGWSFEKISRELQDQGFISHSWAFTALYKVRIKTQKEAAINVIPGEYIISAAMTPDEIFEALKKQEVNYTNVTIPEGYSLEQIAERISQSGLVTKTELLSVASDPAFIASNEILSNSIEGYPFQALISLQDQITLRLS